MKLVTRLILAFLCLAMLLCMLGCGAQTPDATDPIIETDPPVDPLVLYSTARQAVEAAPNLRLVISMTEQRTVGSETYTQSSNTVASYVDLHTDAPSAAVEEKLSFGTYENTYNTYYFDGAAYAQVMDYAFSTAMTIEEFLASQIPAILMDASLYGTITAQTSLAGTTLLFSAPTAPESWISKPADLQLVSAEGSALINKSGRLLSTDYSAQYKIGEAEYALSVSVSVSTPETLDLSAQYPSVLAAATPISSFTAPRRLLQAVGDICATQKLSAGYTETLYCEAAESIRNQKVQIDTQGKDDSFSAIVDYTATLTNYAGLSDVNTQKDTFENGIYSSSLNGAIPTVLHNVTVQQMRTFCEDMVLSALLSIDYISGAQLVDNGSTYTLQLAGTEAMAEDLCDSIYAMLKHDLDSEAESYSTSRVGGYLTVDKATGLPLEAGIFLTRTHVISGSAYTMTYDLSETIALPAQQ